MNKPTEQDKPLWTRLQHRKRDLSLERAIYENSAAFKRRVEQCRVDAEKLMERKS